jgi:predicted DNA binding CopG/RHH family protein
MTKPKRQKLRPIPVFKNEAEEREFWENHDTTEYFDLSKARRASFPNLKRSTRAVSVRLPLSMIDELKKLANRSDVPYQSLMKIYLTDRINVERKRKAG